MFSACEDNSRTICTYVRVFGLLKGPLPLDHWRFSQSVPVGPYKLVLHQPSYRDSAFIIPFETVTEPLFHMIFHPAYLFLFWVIVLYQVHCILSRCYGINNDIHYSLLMHSTSNDPHHRRWKNVSACGRYWH